MRFDSKQKVYVAVCLTTVGSVLLSLLFTGILRGKLSNISTLVPSIVVPLCVAPLASLWGFSQAYKIEMLNKKLASLLDHDPLTNLYSRSYFFEAAAKSSSSQTAMILMADADHFKEINDSYGHHSGDQALRHFSDLISRQCRKTDVVARLGGEEFAVYMPDTDIATALLVAERIRSEIFKNPLRVGDTGIPLSISIGIALRKPDDAIEEALRRADAALYRAKSEGRNRVSLDTRSALLDKVEFSFEALA